MTTYAKFKEYIWLVNCISRARAITLRDINEQWVLTDMSGGLPMSRNTFFRHRCAIEDIFGIIIECDMRHGNKYHIRNDYVLREDSVQNWMLSTLTVGNMLGESQSLHERILLENVPSGGDMLQRVISAMREARRVVVTYRRYGAGDDSHYELAPLCIKLFRQRWYLLAAFDNGRKSIFAFDRIRSVTTSDQRFKADDDFDAQAYFADSYGIVVDHDVDRERVVLRAWGNERYYQRDLPMHHSQRQIAATDDHTDFELTLRPTDDFKAAVLARGSWLMVVEPQWLADEIARWHSEAAERYRPSTPETAQEGTKST